MINMSKEEGSHTIKISTIVLPITMNTNLKVKEELEKIKNNINIDLRERPKKKIQTKHLFMKRRRKQ